MSLYILDLTGSAAIFSGILAVSTIPYILFAPSAGYLADTVNRKKIMVYLDFISAALMAVYAIIIMTGSDNIIIVASVMFILSVIYTLYNPSVTACIPQIVEKEDLALANGVIQQVGYVVNLAGPIIAGVLYGFMGIKIVVILNAICFFISAVLELFLDIPDLEKKEKPKYPILESFREMKRSFTYLKNEKKTVLGIIISYALTNIFVAPILTVISPYFVKVQLNMTSGIYGFVEAIFVLGMIIGGMLITFKPKLFKIKIIHKTMYPMVIAMITMGIATYIASDSKWVNLGLYSIGGLGIMLSLALSNIVSLTYIQQQVKIDMLGKISAFSTAVATASVAPGQIIYGQLIETDLSLYIILAISVILSIGVVMFVRWNIRNER